MNLIFDFDAPWPRNQEGINNQGFPVFGLDWDGDQHYKSWNGLNYLRHEGTLDAYQSTLQNTDVMTIHDAMSWGRDRGPCDLGKHNHWYINPLLPEETQRYILQYKIEQSLHNKSWGTPLTQGELVELIIQFQHRMENIVLIREKHIALVCG
jgi:hypothetical protein